MNKTPREITSREITTPLGEISYLLIRSARRFTIAIEIDQDLKVKVFAPKSLREKEIADFIRQKARWIFDKIKGFEKRFFTRGKRSYRNGAEFLFLGERYSLRYAPSDGKRLKISLTDKYLEVGIPFDMPAHAVEPSVQKALIVWYRKQAKEILAGRIFPLARFLGVDPSKVTVRSQKKIWGSCHYHSQSVHLNWKMVMAPQAVIDYIIIHELTHLKVPNHSKRFWQKIKKVCPDYSSCESWLDRYGGLMVLS
ncbi:MAG: SprT family zinc-dependent metalloprotease [Candidatus Aceula meridiana]|nr:SprT family zinc-dependent metalloprotease [Candidatus Aceula meridiana]